MLTIITICPHVTSQTWSFSVTKSSWVNAAISGFCIMPRFNCWSSCFKLEISFWYFLMRDFSSIIYERQGRGRRKIEVRASVQIQSTILDIKGEYQINLILRSLNFNTLAPMSKLQCVVCFLAITRGRSHCANELK